MSIGASLFLIAAGAILKWAVTATLAGVDIHVVGTILLIVGIVGLLFSLLWMAVWADRRRDPDRPVVRDRDL